MYTLFAKFGTIDSLELYNMVKSLHLNVTDLIDYVILNGYISLNDIKYIDYICHKFGATEITITQNKTG